MCQEGVSKPNWKGWAVMRQECGRKSWTGVRDRTEQGGRRAGEGEQVKRRQLAGSRPEELWVCLGPAHLPPYFFLLSERQRPVTWSVNSGGTLWGAASAAGGWWGHRGTPLRRRRRSWSGERASSSSPGPRARGPRRLWPASPSCSTRRFPSDKEEQSGTPGSGAPGVPRLR